MLTADACAAVRHPGTAEPHLRSLRVIGIPCIQPELFGKVYGKHVCNITLSKHRHSSGSCCCHQLCLLTTDLYKPLQLSIRHLQSRCKVSPWGLLNTRSNMPSVASSPFSLITTSLLRVIPSPSLHPRWQQSAALNIRASGSSISHLSCLADCASAPLSNSSS